MHSEARMDAVMEPVALTTLIQERMAVLAPLAASAGLSLNSTLMMMPGLPVSGSA
jgi:hypothetical protein